MHDNNLPISRSASICLLFIYAAFWIVKNQLALNILLIITSSFIGLSMAKVSGTYVIFLLLVLRSAMAAPTCKSIDSKLSSCITYIEGLIMGGPPPACCSGVKSIAGDIKGKPDLVALCNCVKSLIAKVGKIDEDRLTTLPKKCGVPIELPRINKNYDCSKIA